MLDKKEEEPAGLVAGSWCVSSFSIISMIMIIIMHHIISHQCPAPSAQRTGYRRQEQEQQGDHNNNMISSMSEDHQ